MKLSTSARDVEEGARLKLTARIESPRTASRVIVEKLSTDIFGEQEWVTVKNVKVKARKKVSFRSVAVDKNRERYRATVIYQTGTRVRSKPVSVTVWRWIPLSDYAPYYETDQVGFGQVQINGRAYAGWGPRYYSTVGTWESRYTPGRHCRAFRAVMGLSDISDDGSSGRLALTADDITVYESTYLTPGVDLRVEVPLASPYRIGLQARDTSAEELTSWPVMGDPALLCTGVK